MEHKYNQLSIERYSTNLAKLLCDRYFTSNQAINGQQLVSFSPVKQVNLFLIQELLLRWNQEMAHLKSPYFDFDNEEVKEALVQFMNILSRKILVKRPHFEPLLQKALADTLLWVADPARVFEEKFLKTQDDISGVKLQASLKYLHLNKEYVRTFLIGLAPGNLPYSNVLNQFRTYLLRNTPDPLPTDQLLGELNVLLPLDKADLLQTQAPASMEPEPEKTPEPMAETPRPAPAPERMPFFKPEPKPEPIPVITPAPPVAATPPSTTLTPPAAPVAAEPMPTAPPPVSPVVPVTPAFTPAREETISNGDGRINDKFRVEKPTLNDRLAKPAAPTLAQNQESKKIESLKDSISINQRFGFINELFNGENMEYYNVIQKLDGFEDAESAKNFVSQDLASRYNWTKKEEHVNKLLRLIDRKFS